MFFFIKPKKIFLEAFVHEDEYLVAKDTPPFVSSLKHVDWFKKVPKGRFDFELMKPHLTVKSCVGILNHLRMGVVIPIWTDLAFKFNNLEWQYRFADRKSTILQHSMSQIPGFYSDHSIFKIESPWFFKTKERNLKFYYSQPFYYNNKPFPFFTPPAINQSIGNFLATSIFFFVKNTDCFETLIEKNTPMLQIFPMDERPIELEVVVLDHKEFQRRRMDKDSVFVSEGLKRIKKEKIYK